MSVVHFSTSGNDRPIIRIGPKQQTMETCRCALWRAINKYADEYATDVEHGIQTVSKRAMAARKNIAKAIKDLENASSR